MATHYRKETLQKLFAAYPTLASAFRNRLEPAWHNLSHAMDKNSELSFDQQIDHAKQAYIELRLWLPRLEAWQRFLSTGDPNQRPAKSLEDL